MKYFLDTEFKEKPNTIDLISIGIVAEDGREYYAVSKDFNLQEVWKDEWLRNNVLSTIHADLSKIIENDISRDLYDNCHFEPFTKRSLKNLINWYGKSNIQIAQEIKYFVANVPTEQAEGTLEAAMEYNRPYFYGYYADYDWVVFCWIFGRMIDLPKGFPMYCRDLKQMMDEKGLDKQWKRDRCPDPKGEHNALIDARWNLDLYNKIKSKAKQ